MLRFLHHQPGYGCCRHRIHTAYVVPDDTNHCDKEQCLRTPGSILSCILGCSAQRLSPTPPSCSGHCHQARSPYPANSASQSDAVTTEINADPTCGQVGPRISPDSGSWLPFSTKSKGHNAVRCGSTCCYTAPYATAVTGTSTDPVSRGVSFGRSTGPTNATSSYSEVRTTGRGPKKAAAETVPPADRTAAAPDDGQTHSSVPANESSTPSQQPSRRLYVPTRETPSFVKHESIQTSLPKTTATFESASLSKNSAKARSHSAFAIVHNMGDNPTKLPFASFITPPSADHLTSQHQGTVPQKSSGKPNLDDCYHFRRHTHYQNCHHGYWWDRAHHKWDIGQNWDLGEEKWNFGRDKWHRWDTVDNNWEMGPEKWSTERNKWDKVESKWGTGRNKWYHHCSHHAYGTPHCHHNRSKPHCNHHRTPKMVTTTRKKGTGESRERTTCAGFFINISKEDWKSLLKEALNQIGNVIRRARGTILLDRMPSRKSSEHERVWCSHSASSDAIRWYDAFCNDEVKEHCSCAYGHGSANDGFGYQYTNCFHRNNDDKNFFYPAEGIGMRGTDGQLFSFFDDIGEEFFDCECQL